MPLTSGKSISLLPAEDRLQTVVVALRDRIELVIVATGTSQREPQKDTAGRVGPIGQALVVELLPVHVRFVNLRTQRVQARANASLEMRELFLGHRIAARQRQVIGPNLVARDLFLHEPIVWLVVVEALDDVVAIAPGIAKIHVGLIATAVGVASHVEPVAAPTFAIVGRRQQLVDQLGQRVARVVGDELFDFLDRRRQPHQVEIEATNERPIVGPRSQRQPVLVDLG